MVRVNNCCGCCDVKSGSIAISIIFLILAVANMALGLAGVVGTPGATTYVSASIDGVMALLCILLVIGVIKDNHILCMVWVVGAIVWSVLMTIIGIVVSVLASLLVNAAAHIDPGPDQPKVDPGAAGGALAIVLGIMWAVVAVEICLVIYSAIVVYSHAQNLREGGGPPPYSQFGAPKAI